MTSDVTESSGSNTQSLTLNLTWMEDSNKYRNIILKLNKNPVHDQRIPLYGTDDESGRTIQTDLLNLKVGVIMNILFIHQ